MSGRHEHPTAGQRTGGPATDGRPTADGGSDVPDLVGPDWAWRHRLRQNPAAYRMYRYVVAIVGLVFVAGGLLLVPLPGPGWLIVFFGIAVWASEFAWAQGLLAFGKRTLRRWEEWLRARSRWVQAGVALATFAFVAVVVWVTLRLTGLPGFLPDGVAGWLGTTLHL